MERSASSCVLCKRGFVCRDVQALVSCASVFEWRDVRYAFCPKPVCKMAQTLRNHPYSSVPIRTHPYPSVPAAISAQRTAAADFAAAAACPSGPSGPSCQVFRDQTCASVLITRLSFCRLKLLLYQKFDFFSKYYCTLQKTCYSISVV